MFASSPAAPPAPRVRLGHTSYRGTRILVAFILGFAGLFLLGFAVVAVPFAQRSSASPADPGLMSTLVRLQIPLVAFGVAHLAAAAGVWRDRQWGFDIAAWVLAGATFILLAGIVFALAGRDPLAVATATSSGDRTGAAILVWTLAWYGVAAWGVARIVVARSAG